MKNIFIALENIRSLYNIGAIFRTCSFFGISRILLVGYTGKNTLPNGKIVLHEEIKKSSLGSENDLEITFLENSEDFIKFARENKLSLSAVEQSEKSIKLQAWIPKNNSILVFGNEVTGVSEEILKEADEIIEIEKKGRHNSLNVTTTAGIILYQTIQEH